MCELYFAFLTTLTGFPSSRRGVGLQSLLHPLGFLTSVCEPTSNVGLVQDNFTCRVAAVALFVV